MVVGSNPAGPITNDFLSEVLNLREMMEVLLGTEGRRKLRLQKKPNSELFELYAGELTIRHRSAAALKEAKRLLGHFESFLDSNPPTAELATSFLARSGALKSNTLYRYHSIINGFMTWYGERLETKVRVPKTLPQYIEDVEVEKLKDALRQNQSHKGVIERNLLLVEIMANTGLRREEVANLKTGDIDLQRQFLVVRHGKGEKDRIVDLIPSLSESLRRYIGIGHQRNRCLASIPAVSRTSSAEQPGGRG
ncbi:tyrosine-type recombinase/integrase [Chloroflexota bacterium]